MPPWPFLPAILAFLDAKWRRTEARRVCRGWNAAVYDAVRLSAGWAKAVAARSVVLRGVADITPCLKGSNVGRILTHLDLELSAPQKASAYKHLTALRLSSLALRLRGFSDGQAAAAIAAINIDAPLHTLTIDTAQGRAGRATVDAIVRKLRPLRRRGERPLEQLPIPAASAARVQCEGAVAAVRAMPRGKSTTPAPHPPGLAQTIDGNGGGKHNKRRDGSRRKRKREELGGGGVGAVGSSAPPRMERTFHNVGRRLTLAFRDCRLDDAMVGELAWALFPLVARDGDDIDDDGAGAAGASRGARVNLTAAPRLEDLTLDLRSNYITERGVRAIAAAARKMVYLRALRVDVGRCPLAVDPAAAAAATPPLPPGPRPRAVVDAPRSGAGSQCPSTEDASSHGPRGVLPSILAAHHLTDVTLGLAECGTTSVLGAVGNRVAGGGSGTLSCWRGRNGDANDAYPLAPRVGGMGATAVEAGEASAVPTLAYGMFGGSAPSALRRLRLDVSDNPLPHGEIAAVCGYLAALPDLREVALHLGGTVSDGGGDGRASPTSGAAGPLDGLRLLAQSATVRSISYAVPRCEVHAAALQDACEALADNPSLIVLALDLCECRLGAAALCLPMLLASESLCDVTLDVRRNLLNDAHAAFITDFLLPNTPAQCRLARVAINVEGNYISAQCAAACRAALADSRVPDRSVVLARSAGRDPGAVHMTGWLYA